MEYFDFTEDFKFPIALSHIYIFYESEKSYITSDIEDSNQNIHSMWNSGQNVIAECIWNPLL